LKKTFAIEAFPKSAGHYCRGSVVVAIDVIRTTTMAISAVSTGRRCFPVDSIHAALALASKLHDPLLAGEINGECCTGLEMNNSPAELAKRSDIHRPLVLLSSSGTQLILNARGCDVLYLACFRNSLSVARHLIGQNHGKVALVGASSRGEFREEDQICCARIARVLADAGYIPENKTTALILNRWADAKPTDCLVSQSIGYLKRTGQIADLHFILEKIDDLDEIFILRNHEVIAVTPETAGSSFESVRSFTAE
jgi:2-phosphosulfolactate phosphatase